MKIDIHSPFDDWMEQSSNRKKSRFPNEGYMERTRQIGRNRRYSSRGRNSGNNRKQGFN